MTKMIVPTLLLLLASFFSCNKEKEVIVCPKLNNIISEMLEKRPGSKVILIFSYHIGNADLIEIHTSPIYEEYMTDGYFFLDSTLVTYFSFDSINREHIINTKLMNRYKGTIPGYESSSQVYYEPLSEMYIIRNSNFIRIDEDSMYDFTKASSGNMIRNKWMNDSLNHFINNHHSILYSLRFIKRHDNGKLYVIIRPETHYDKDKCDGYFYRDGHLITIYGARNLDGADIINKDSLIKIGDSAGIPNFRNIPIPATRGVLPRPRIYEMITNGKLKRLNEMEIFSLEGEDERQSI